jgi:hypothetical protein
MQAYIAREQAREAEAARYSSLGLYYKAGNEATTQAAVTTESARYSGLAEFYGVENRSEAAIAADSARYSGLAEFYGVKPGVGSLAWPPRPAQFKPIEESAVIPADALVVYHQSEWGLALNKTDADGDIGLMEFPSIEK